MGKRNYYIDNLRWMLLLLLVPYHTSIAWNVWNEPNYIFFEGNKIISSIIVFFSPFYMPTLFLMAGISARFSLNKRTTQQYVVERVKKLLIPLIFGTVTFMPIMTYLADKFNHSYQGSFIRHYAVFFTKFTDLVGADGGFSFGQFWFLLYLFVIAIIALGIMYLFKSKNVKLFPFWVIVVLGLPLPFLSNLLSVGGKSFAEYMFLFLVGYYVFADENVILKLENYRIFLCLVGIVSAAVNVYLFIWSLKEYPILNTATKFIAEWFMMLALLGMSKRYLNFTGRVSKYMSSRAFLFFSFHFVWVVVFQYLLYLMFGNKTGILFLGTVALSYIVSFVCCEIAIRIPFVRFFMGVKRPTD